MPLLSAVFAADVDHVIKDMPATIIWRGQTLTVAAGDLAKGNKLEIEGMLINPDISFVCRAADFTTDRKPAANDKLTYGAERLRIAQVTLAPDGSAYLLHCVAESS
jgi:hypothetical protein